MMPDELRIALLGPLTVVRAGQAIVESAWRSRQERRLFGILLTARGARVPSDRLIEWLWPDADKDAAGVTLRSAISSLRHTLGPADSGRASSRYIATKPGGYAWNSESGAWIDIEEFFACLQPGADEGRKTKGAPPNREDAPSQHTNRAHDLERAIALYRGDYLEDEGDAPWATGLRDMLRERFLTAIADLAALRLDMGQYSAAIMLAQRGLERDRLREPLYRTLMRAQARAGDIAGALQSHDRYRRALDEELGATPSAQTQMLHAAILRGEESAGALRRQDQDARAGGAAQAFTPPRAAVLATNPFVGRTQELAALRGWIDELAQQRGGIVAIVGEAGIGKTRLVAEGLRLAASRGAMGIMLRCSALERGLPLAPISESLRSLMRVAPEPVLRRLPPTALAQVSDLLPILRERLPDLPALAAAPSADRRNRLLDGFVDLALALARDVALVICCDDAQWADDATLAVLGRLARRASRHPLLLILAYRSEELAENPALHGLLRALGRDMLLRPLVLGRLDAAEVTQLLAVLSQMRPERLARMARRMADLTGGNPLFLHIALQSLLESHEAASLAALLNDPDVQLPDLAGAPQARDLVLARADRLPAPARELLEQLAVIGRSASLDLIEALGGASGLEAAQTLLDRQFLIEGADGQLTFSHELVRSIIATTLSAPRRRLFHRQAAEAIDALHGDRPERAAELAFHFSQAGHDAEASALRYMVIAGEHARRSFGYREALNHYDGALRAAERLGARVPASDARQAFAGRLLACEALLDWDGIMDTAARFDRWTTRHGAPLAPLAPPRRLALLRALMGDLAGAAAISAEQMRAGQSEAPPVIQDMLRRTATILQPAEPPPTYENLEALTQEDGGFWARLLAASSHLHIAPLTPPPCDPAADLPALLGHDEAALALFQIGWAALMQGLTQAAEPCLLRAYELADTTGQAAVAVVAALQLGQLNALRGDPAEAARWLEQSLELARRAPEANWATIWPRIHQAFVWLFDGQHAMARAQFENLAAHLHDRPAFQSHRASVEVGLGLAALARGDESEAARWLGTALASPQLLYGFVYVAAWHGRARLAALRGDLAHARTALAHALDYSARRCLLPEYIRTAIEIARLERDYGHPAATITLLRTAVDLATEAGMGALAGAAQGLLGRFSIANA